MRPFVYFVPLFGFLSVLFGAIGSHALKSRISPEMFKIFETAVLFMMFHSGSLLLVCFLIFVAQNSLGISRERRSSTELVGVTGLRLSGHAFLAVQVLFSFSLIAYSITEVKFLTKFAPFGGLLSLLAHANIFVWTIKHRKRLAS
ncbi:MAG: hypothetical protein COT74_03970 [Bdellovibrionales bacterium CG10_big_fil_rev_8_21_14_0_10_45_34]|nr:MAG: hypothetical protein COT74_03970 [Bdellovibrionales bacterium CG10_big_fil_rev_8_21_14_0_10_45_34]